MDTRFDFGALILALVVGMFLASCGSSRSPLASGPLERATPGAVNIDPASLKAMLEDLTSNKLDIDSLTVVKDDKVVLESSWYPFQSTDQHLINSSTKSVISLLIGIALKERKLKSVRQTLGDFFASDQDLKANPEKAKITIEDLLTMDSGIDWHESDRNYSDAENSFNKLSRSGNWVDFHRCPVNF